MTVRFTITLVGDIDSPVFPGAHLPSAIQNASDLIKLILTTPLVEKIKALTEPEGPMREALIFHADADIALARELLKNMQIRAEVLPLTETELYVVAKRYVDAVAADQGAVRNNRRPPNHDSYKLGALLDKACQDYSKQNNLSGYPLGQLREAAMNGWPLPEAT